MHRNRNISVSEQLMIAVLTEVDQPLTLDEIVSRMLAINPQILIGKTPKKSLYSIVYRREKRRQVKGLPLLFETSIRGGATHYSIKV
jgi:hypothetical protein